MSDDAKTRLSELLDRLGPGLRLRADRGIMVEAFGSDNTAANAAAFARERGCRFLHLSGRGHDDAVGEFARQAGDGGSS